METNGADSQLPVTKKEVEALLAVYQVEINGKIDALFNSYSEQRRLKEAGQLLSTAANLAEYKINEPPKKVCP